MPQIFDNIDLQLLPTLRHTLEVADLWVSAPLLAEARTRSYLEVTGELQALPFDAAAYSWSFFA